MKIRDKKNQLLIVMIGIFLLTPAICFAQVKGNKQIETRAFPAESIQSISINLYAEVIIDCSAPEGLSITTDSNLFDLIVKSMQEKELILNQKEWIQPSRKVKIRIGAPALKKVTTGTHELTKVINIDNDEFEIVCPIGTIKLQGRTKLLTVANKIADLDASELIAENAFVNIESRGSAKLNVRDEIDTKLSMNARLTLVNTPVSLLGDSKNLVGETEKSSKDVSYIDFKIKNNSGNRHNFVVIGPKKNGKSFSYGFPMMPLTTRKERWTTGTKVYKVNSLGIRELLVTISTEDEGQTVKLF